MTTKSQAEHRTRFETSSGIDLPADFNPANTEPIDYEKDLNSPGDFPYTRRIYPNMYRYPNFSDFTGGQRIIGIQTNLSRQIESY